ncbi:hypothetical protein [Clostridium lacusfryxellense]|uniref:hypothetical protein n=1 Tax=Clostridium lacusfryxellense TaxID=205328 RepID=UPI001C0C327D|nr:hypothetical protein [Clostridium lacusfryxellense]MBU3114874.1 hypothetical protein [Clostridium lacusfryxellense]
MNTIVGFTFEPRYTSLDVIKEVFVGNKILNALILDDETCLGHRQVGSRSYHIFYFKNDRFSVYYHKGGTDAMYSSDSLDIVLDYVNKLDPKDFE